MVFWAIGWFLASVTGIVFLMLLVAAGNEPPPLDRP